MFRNYLKLAFRTLEKKQIFSFINIFGLAIGMAVCLLILQYVYFELSYDRFHENGNRIYRFTTEHILEGSSIKVSGFTYSAMGPTLKEKFPEIDRYSRYHLDWGGSVVSIPGDNGELENYSEEGICFTDPDFLNMLNFEMISGNRDNPFPTLNSILLTESMVEKYYGDPYADVIGKDLTLNGGWAPGAYQVSGVLKDIPENSHIRFDFLVSVDRLLRNNQYSKTEGWNWDNFMLYIQLKEKAAETLLESKLADFTDEYLEMTRATKNDHVIFDLEPLRDIHLYSDVEDDSDTVAKADFRTVYGFALIAGFILLIAWINYINLSTAQSMERAKEVGIKKSLGVSRKQLIYQFLGESVLINLAAMMISVLIAALVMSWLSSVVGKQISFTLLSEVWFMGSLVLLFLTGSILAGLYPAFVLSSQSGIISIHGQFHSSRKGILLRKGLVTFQFFCSMILIAGTYTVFKQIRFMQSQELGFNLDQIVVVEGPDVYSREELGSSLHAFKNELDGKSFVKRVATSTNVPGGGFTLGTKSRKLGDPAHEVHSCNVMWVDKDFIPTYEIQVLAGKDFSDFNPEGGNGLLINEKAVEVFGMDSPEEAITHHVIFGKDTIPIRGVMKNYHWNSLRSEQVPIFLSVLPVARSKISVKIAGSNYQEAITEIQQIYKDMFPGNPFEYEFLDVAFGRQYRADQQFGEIFGFFATLAIIVACLGLFGLSSFITTQRTKEIGIRKVLGANISSIIIMLSRYFIQFVILAAIIAIPVLYYTLNSWLETYPYRTDITWKVFTFPALILIIIALVTVSYHSIRSALTNPVETLKSE